MKRCVMAFIVLASIVSASCGNVTDVGNPTSIILTGELNVGSIDADLSYVKQSGTSQYSVVAENESSTAYTSDVADDGIFSLDLPVDNTYAMYVYESGIKIGDFSFEQDDEGDRANRLVVSADQPDGEVVEMGVVTYQHGGFRPEREPRREMRGRQ